VATVGRVLLYCQKLCRCDMHHDQQLVPAVVISRLKKINIFKYNDSDSLGRFVWCQFPVYLALHMRQAYRLRKHFL
jgi:hypothetical protein